MENAGRLPRALTTYHFHLHLPLTLYCTAPKSAPRKAAAFWTLNAQTYAQAYAQYEESSSELLNTQDEAIDSPTAFSILHQQYF